MRRAGGQVLVKGYEVSDPPFALAAVVPSRSGGEIDARGGRSPEAADALERRDAVAKCPQDAGARKDLRGAHAPARALLRAIEREPETMRRLLSHAA